jgi:hypothetical protein
MKLLPILLLISTVAFSQSDKKIIKNFFERQFYVQTADMIEQEYCGLQLGRMYVGKKRFIFESREVFIDIKFYKRKKNVYYGKDGSGNKYYFQAVTINNDLGLLITPSEANGKVAVLITRVNVCEL